MGRVFPHSRVANFGELEIELQSSDCSQYEQEIRSIALDVLRIATRSRGWDDPESDRHFEANFKIEPLFYASGLALVRKRGELVGIAGCVRNWEVSDCSLVHLCSLGFLPTAQGRGLLPALMGLLWAVCWQDSRFREMCGKGAAYASAITQSPYLIAYFDRLFELYPSPDRAINDTVTRLAGAVIERFDPHLSLEPGTLILRKECQFFYKELPYSTNRRINEYCDQMLRYAEGDVFVVLGRVVPDRIEALVDGARRKYPEILALAKG